MALTPAWFAWLTVKEGVSANAALRMAQEAGLGVRRSAFLSMVGEIRAHYSRSVVEPSRPLNRRPSGAAEIGRIGGSTQRGYVQYVDLFVRNKTTGAITIRSQALRTATLKSRQVAIDTLVNRYRRAVDRSKTAVALWGTDPDEVVMGGIYTATHQFTE